MATKKEPTFVHTIVGMTVTEEVDSFYVKANVVGVYKSSLRYVKNKVRELEKANSKVYYHISSHQLEII